MSDPLIGLTAAHAGLTTGGVIHYALRWWWEPEKRASRWWAPLVLLVTVMGGSYLAGRYYLTTPDLQTTGGLIFACWIGAGVGFALGWVPLRRHLRPRSAPLILAPEGLRNP